jgi:hypothetical protein
MERILLASYAIKIKDNGHDQILNQFNGTNDWLLLFQQFCQDIFQNTTRAASLTGETTVHLTLEEPETYNETNRVIYGRFSSGVSGESYTVVDTNTNLPEMNVEPHHAAFRNVFFYLYVPIGRNIAYLILQRIQKFGIKTVLTRAIRSYMNEQGYQRYRFDIMNILHDSVYQRMMTLGVLKSVDLIKRTIPNSIERYLQNDNNIIEIPGTFKTSFNSSTSLPQDWKGMLDRLFRQHDGNNNRILIDNVDDMFDEIEFEIELNGKKKTFYIVNRHKIQPDVDVTSNVEIINGEPTIDSLISQANEIINEILEIHV